MYPLNTRDIHRTNMSFILKELPRQELVSLHGRQGYRAISCRSAHLHLHKRALILEGSTANTGPSNRTPRLYKLSLNMVPPPVTEDYYLVLEVSQSATAEQITKSYKRLALKLHPDRNAEGSSTQAFQLVSCSYEARWL